MASRLRLTGRLLGAAAVGATAGVHLQLWLNDGYRTVPTIGPLFLLDVAGGGLLAGGLLLGPRRWLGIVAPAGAAYEAATMAGLLLATTRGLFGFYESSAAPLYALSLAVESTGALVLAGLTGLCLRRRRPARGPRPRSA